MVQSGEAGCRVFTGQGGLRKPIVTCRYRAGTVFGATSSQRCMMPVVALSSDGCSVLVCCYRSLATVNPVDVGVEAQRSTTVI